MMKKARVLQSPALERLRKERRGKFLKKFYIVAGILIFGLGGFAFVSRLDGLNIKSVEVSGNSIIEAEEISETVMETISGKYLGLFPKSNFLIYPKNALAENLSLKYKRLDDIEIKLERDGVIRIEVTEREPAYRWCDAEPVKEGCYFMDNSGYIFDAAPYFSGDVYFKFSGPLGVNLEDPLGSSFAPEYFTKLTGFKDTVRELGLEPVGIYLEESGDGEVALKSIGVNKPKILFNVAADAENLGENLAAALRTEPLKSRLYKEYMKLEYLDLRFGNKVYSKFSK